MDLTSFLHLWHATFLPKVKYTGKILGRLFKFYKNFT